MEARTKRTEARISASPQELCHGKCGDRIHNSSGIMTIRLIVMELGRFTCVALPDEQARIGSIIALEHAGCA
jgi:hypothetical protein